MLLCLASVSHFLLTGVGWCFFFCEKRIRATRSLCASSQFARVFDVRVQLSFLLSARASCGKRILASRLCASSQLARSHSDRVAGSSALCVSACGKRIGLPSIRISSKQSVSVLSIPDVTCRPNADRRSCACTSISGLVPSFPKLLSKVSSGLVLTLQFLIVFSVQKLLMNASSGLVLTLLSLGVSCHSLGLSSRCCRQSWDPNLGGQVLGPCPCAGQTYWPVAMSNLVGTRQRRLDHVLAQACYRLVAVQRRRCFVYDSQIFFGKES